MRKIGYGVILVVFLIMGALCCLANDWMYNQLQIMVFKTQVKVSLFLNYEPSTYFQIYYPELDSINQLVDLAQEMDEMLSSRKNVERKVYYAIDIIGFDSIYCVYKDSARNQVLTLRFGQSNDSTSLSICFYDRSEGLTPYDQSFTSYINAYRQTYKGDHE